MAASGGGGTATAANPQQQQQQQKQGAGGGGAQQGQQNKRPSRWTGAHSFGSNSANSSNANNARSQSPLNPTAVNKSAAGAAAGVAGGQAVAVNHASSAAGVPSTAASSSSSFANITATPDELAKMHDRMLFLFANLVGHKVRCTLRTGIVYTAILSTINDVDLSVCLKFARQVEPPVQANGDATGSVAALPPLKPALVVSAKDVIDISAENVSLDAATVSSVPGASRPTSPNVSNAASAAANQAAMSNIMAALGGDTFRTDTDISGTGASREQRELQRWGMGDAIGGGLEDGGLEGSSNNGGGKSRGGAWDQFAVNERLFGTKTDYQEEIYTTKLDKSGADYKAREARAARIAEEIQSGVALNSHVAEERGGPATVADDSGMDEEDKYSGVIRGQGAYVPPGARRALAIQTPPPAAQAQAQTKAKAEPAKTNGTATQATVPPIEAKVAPAAAQAAPATPATQQQPASTTVTPANKEDLVGDFKKFVTNEKEKLVQKRSQLEKQNKDKRMAELKSWSAAFVLKTPVPADLVPILAKDEAKQQEIVNRKPSPSVTPSSTATALKPASTHTSPNPQVTALKAPSIPSSTQNTPRPAQAAVPEKKASAWAVPSIPAFDPQRAAAARAAKAAAAASTTAPAASSTPATKFNVAAKEFVFRPTAGSFVPGGAAAAPAQVSATPSPAPAPAAVPVPLVRKPSETASLPVTAVAPAPVQPLNPFFGTRIIRNNNNAPFRVKEDFSPFKRNEKIPDPATVQPAWGFTGKTYKAAASYSFPSTSTATHAVSPQPSHALPPHMQQGSNGRLHGVASPPLSSQASHLSRTSSSQGVSAHTPSLATSVPSSEDGMTKSGIATPVPSSSTSNSGVPTGVNGQIPTMPVHQQAPPHGVAGQSHMMPQGFVYQPQGQQYPTFRYVPGMHPQTPGHVQSPGGQQGHHPHMLHQQHLQQMQQQQMAGHQMQGQPTQFVMGPNGQSIPVMGGQFFPPGAVPAMLSPHMAGQMAQGQQQFMQPMRGQNGQMIAGQPHQVFYPVQGSPAMQHHYMQMTQQAGMPVGPSQQMFEQPGQ